jgi:predicted anti-sigma-YlaC factor YlaD
MSDFLTDHLSAAEIELWAQGLLPAARDAHVAQCEQCRATAERERKLYRDLAQLTRFAPEFGFAERVMARVRIPTPSGGFEKRRSGGFDKR